MNAKFDFNDITLTPTELSDVRSRGQCSIYHGKNLPLMCAPMDTVINKQNVNEFKKLGIITCSIRNSLINLNQPDFNFVSVSLEQFEYLVNHAFPETFNGCKGILIDIANGHMTYLYFLVREFKKKYPTLPLMVGNIALPATYGSFSEILTEIDYVRCGIGGGSACTSSANTAIHYPYASLIEECFLIKEKGLNKEGGFPKIVADGGFRNFDEINKALNLGADYVMIGSIFAKSLEACGETFWKGFNVTKHKQWFFEKGLKLTRKYRGMSTKDVQLSLGKTVLKTAEGISYTTPVQYTLKGWVTNFKDYLKSCMSYSGTRTLNEFIGNRNYVFITENALKRFKK